MPDNPEEEKDKTKSIWLKIKEVVPTIAKMPRVFGLVWKANAGLASVFVFSQIILGLLPLIDVWVIKILVDTVPTLVNSSKDPHTLASLPWTLSVALVLMGFSWFANESLAPTLTYCSEQLNDYLSRDINLMIMDKVNSIVDIAILENPKFYDQLQRVQNDLAYKPIQMLGVFSNLGQAVIALTGLTFLVGSLSPWLLVFIFAFSAPKVILQLKHMYEIWEVLDGDVPELRRMNYYRNVLTNNQDGKEIRLFGLGGFFRKLFLETFTDFQKKREKLRRNQLLWNSLLAVLSGLGTVGGFLFAVMQAIAGRVSAGSMAMFVGAIGQMESRLSNVAFFISELYRHTLFVNRLFDFLEIEPVISRASTSACKPLSLPLKSGIEFRNVSFKYPASERLILDSVSFKIEPHQTVALVGENGAGKTTIVKLLSRFYDPSGGEILIDGIDLRELDPVEWRAQMAVVFQDYCRFHMTVKENIGLGSVDQLGSDEHVKSAAERGGASSLVDKLPEGYNTMLGKVLEGKEAIGTELSGGEWQKIALSRAFMRSIKLASGDADSAELKQAQLLILDEPTAALDVQSEHDVYCRFHELTKDKMALLITHRFSTVRIADKILVLENGKVIEEGSHQELISSDTNYARLYNLQAERYR